MLVPVELDMLEGLAEAGHDPAKLIIEWKALPKKIALRNFLIHKFRTSQHLFRPKRMSARVDAVFSDMEARL